MDTTTLAARRDRALGAGAPLFYNTPLHIVRGEGVYLFDADGRRYVDMYNNVPCVGHANPHVVEAMARQQAHAQRPQPLSARRDRRLRRAPRGPARAGDRERHLQLLRDRGQRGGAAHGAPRDRQDRHRLHQRDLSRQQRGGREDDPHRHRPATPRATCAPFPSPRSSARWCRAPARTSSRRPISTACATRSAASRTTARASPADRVLDLRQRGTARRAARLHGARRRDRARRRRPGDRRRGPGRLLPHRPLVGLRAPASRPTSSSPASRWATACRWPPPPRAGRWSRASAPRRAISTPLPRARCRRRSAWPCSTSSSATACARTSPASGAFLKAALAERKARFASIADVRGHGLFIGVEIAKDGDAPDARSRPRRSRSSIASRTRAS